MGAGNPDDMKDSPMHHYLVAKKKADQHLIKSGLNFSIVRPGGLTDDAGTGKIEAAESLGKRGKISREDVAKTLIAVLETETAADAYFEIIAGEDKINVAVEQLMASHS